MVRIVVLKSYISLYCTRSLNQGVVFGNYEKRRSQEREEEFARIVRGVLLVTRSSQFGAYGYKVRVFLTIVMGLGIT